nr:DEAD/DEAH box helicase [uncultured Dyadobacter sp.]
MVDFSKRLKRSELEIKINPIDVYESLDRKSVAGPLRTVQKLILEEWFHNFKQKRDVIVKLHTGEGKTLIGLLILQSRINENKKPVLYVCPNKYLVQQVVQDAKKFGIPYCLIDEVDNSLPSDFLEGKRILITHVQKVFNGKSIFGFNQSFVPVGSLVLDDSHACIDSIKNSFTLSIQRQHDLYDKFLELFEDDLVEQGEGTFIDIKNNHYDTLLPIPYWSWIDKKSQVTALLSSYQDDNAIKFLWPAIKNSVENCQAFITSSKIEISPYSIPVDQFGTFSKADQRILMSATTQDDSFFIKGLGFQQDAVKSPLSNTSQIWSGEKMILIPSLIDDAFDTDYIIRQFAPPRDRSFGVVVLVPSFRKSENYRHQGALVAGRDNIFEGVSNLKNEKFGTTLVIVNRYDGIDLPDNACRVLIVDGLPFLESLVDKYEELCRTGSEIVSVRLAQRIEQGLGRSVRGEKDYSIILLTGADLIRFVKGSRTTRFFSSQTKKQIDLGMEVVDMARNEIADGEVAKKVVNDLMRQCLTRDEGWKTFYKDEMDSLKQNVETSKVYHLLQLEKEADDACNAGQFEVAAEKIQKLVDTHEMDPAEKAWYLQAKARYTYHFSKSESNSLQKAAFLKNFQLLKPRDGISYKKIQYKSDNRIKRVRDWIQQFENYDELYLNLLDILNALSFGADADKFEGALFELGVLLGFESQRPDKEIKKGPDNLWCGVDNKYFLFECKSEVDLKRKDIHKDEAGQMNTHCGWFDLNYGKEVSVTRIWIIPTSKLSYSADLTHEVFVMTKPGLDKLKENVKAFFKELRQLILNDINDNTIHNGLTVNHLTVKELRSMYVEPIKLNRSK